MRNLKPPSARLWSHVVLSSCLAVAGLSGCPATEEGQSDTSSPGETVDQDTSLPDDTTTPDDASDGAESEVDAPPTPVALAPTEAMAVDPTSATATYAVDLVIGGPAGAVTGAAAMVDGTRLTPVGEATTIAITGLPATAMVHGVAMAEGHLPRAFSLTVANAGRVQVLLDPVAATLPLEPGEAGQIAVGAGHLGVPADAFGTTPGLALRAADLDVVQAASGQAASVAARVLARMPSTTGAVAVDKSGNAFLPAVAARLDVDVRNAAGAEVPLAQGVELSYALPISPLISSRFEPGSVQPLFHFDPASARYEEVGTCVVVGDTCVGSAASAGAALLFPPDPVFYAFGCAHARVKVSRDPSVSLSQRSVGIEAWVESSLDPIVPETQYAVDGDALKLTAVFPFVTTSLDLDQPRFRVVSAGQVPGADGDGFTVRQVSPEAMGIMLRGSNADVFAACRELMPAVDVEILHQPPQPSLDMPPDVIEAEFEDAQAPPAHLTCTPEELVWATVSPSDTPCGDSRLMCIGSDESGSLDLPGWTRGVTISCGPGCQVWGYGSDPQGNVQTARTSEGGSFELAEGSAILWLLTENIAEDGSAEAQVDFGAASSELGPGWRFVLSPSGVATKLVDDVSVPDTMTIVTSQSIEPYGGIFGAEGSDAPPNWAFPDGNTIVYTGDNYETRALAPLLLVPEGASAVTFRLPGELHARGDSQKGRLLALAIGLVRLPVCEEVSP